VVKVEELVSTVKEDLEVVEEWAVQATPGQRPPTILVLMLRVVLILHLKLIITTILVDFQGLLAQEGEMVQPSQPVERTPRMEIISL
jgi:hypothetical protein